MDDKPRGCGAPLAIMLALSVVLGWLPVLGPFIAGYAGGRSARAAGTAVMAALPVSVLWGVGLFLASQHSYTYHGSTLGGWVLAFFVPAMALGILGGALFGARGAGFNVLGVLVTALGLALTGFWAWRSPQTREALSAYRTFQPAPAAPAAPVQPTDTTCAERLGRLYRATQLYAADWDDTYPPAGHWMSALADPVQPKAEEEALHCPQAGQPGSAQYGYAMNEAVGGKRRAAGAAPGQTPLYYDSSTLTRDAHDAFASLPKPGRHGGKDNVVYADGHVAPTEPK